MRKAPLSTSHGGPTKILKKAKDFVEKTKYDSLMNMNLLFDNINKNRHRSSVTNSTKLSRAGSPSPSNPEQSDNAYSAKMFLQLISARLTKKVFLAKQKFKFLKSMVQNK